jgi:hypothetical protein
MHGRKLEQLKQAMSTILNDLNQADLFSIVLFSTEVQVMTDQCLCVKEPLEYVTYIYIALEQNN